MQDAYAVQIVRAIEAVERQLSIIARLLEQLTKAQKPPTPQPEAPAGRSVA